MAPGVAHWRWRTWKACSRIAALPGQKGSVVLYCARTSDCLAVCWWSSMMVYFLLFFRSPSHFCWLYVSPLSEQDLSFLHARSDSYPYQADSRLEKRLLLETRGLNTNFGISILSGHWLMISWATSTNRTSYQRWSILPWTKQLGRHRQSTASRMQPVSLDVVSPYSHVEAQKLQCQCQDLCSTQPRPQPRR